MLNGFMISGYCGNESFLLKIADIVKDVKATNPEVIFGKKMFDSV